ncbi:hypothetical protein C8R43DRAFT_1132016 [Mycena crocata]|nr:hypothetical protein C8R43DRAFT_1132016 [Mycena crocata]
MLISVLGHVRLPHVLASDLPIAPVHALFVFGESLTSPIHRPVIAMTNLTINHTAEDDDDALLSRMAQLRLTAVQSPPNTPPRTPSPRPENRRIDAAHTFPAMRSRTYHTDRSALYRFESSTQAGYTRQWSRAGTATQGVPGSHVYVVQPATGGNKRGGKKVAFVVFCGTDTGVFHSWRETQPLVNRVSNCIFRGYTTLAQAEAAFAYAVARSWVRVAGASTSGISQLPRPIGPEDEHNPLNGSETCDDQWYVVYRGIRPGVYRSHLECQLNTLGVQGALHEGVVGRETALAKFYAAQDHFDVDRVSPPEYSA